MQEVLAGHAILRDLGFPAKDIALIESNDGQAQLSWDAYGEPLFINFGKVINFPGFMKDFHRLKADWESGTLVGKDKLLKDSRCYQGRALIGELLEEQNLPKVGPERLN